MAPLSVINVLLVYAIQEVNSQSFIMGPSTMTWNNAQTWCQQLGLGSDLASIHSLAEFNEAWALCQTQATHCWIGLQKLGNSEQWNWEDGSPTDYGFDNNDGTLPTRGVFPWWSGEPNAPTNQLVCVRMRIDINGRYDDHNCGFTYPAICHYVPTFQPTTSPTPAPTTNPTPSPSDDPSEDPTEDPTLNPSGNPSTDPSRLLFIQQICYRLNVSRCYSYSYPNIESRYRSNHSCTNGISLNRSYSRSQCLSDRRSLRSCALDMNANAATKFIHVHS